MSDNEKTKSYSADSITIRTSDNVIHQVTAEEIEDRRTMEKSFMPSGLERTMSRDDLVNLIEYLTQRK